ncbi:MAG: glutathione-disulfide reductase [Gammaproteobacteria bacterium]
MKTSCDVLVIGAGSGGLAVAEKAAALGRKAVVIDAGPLGGTCVNAGCVPKKVMWYAANLAAATQEAHGYGVRVHFDGIDWPRLVAARDRYVADLNAYWQGYLQRSDVAHVQGYAEFVDAQTVRVGAHTYRAEHIVIATGSRPLVPDLPGAALGITSDGFFRLIAQPRRVAIIGGGYIGVELSGVLRAMGSEVTLLARDQRLLRDFDVIVGDVLAVEMQRQGIDVHFEQHVTGLQQSPDGLAVQVRDGAPFTGFDTVIWAIGRTPNTAGLQLERAGIALERDGAIAVDDYQNTAVPGIYAVGDVTGKLPLTPVAIAAGRALAERLFDNRPTRRVDYTTVPSVIFAHPPIAVVGLTEAQAVAAHGAAVTVYETAFTPMRHALSDEPSTTAMKLVCVGAEQRVVGIHLIGHGVDEILQGFAVAMRMGATKADFDATVAIHPSSAEELVTLRQGRPGNLASLLTQAA